METEDLPTRSGFERMLSPAHVSFNTGENEWYTPWIYVEAARDVMGTIDTDPASSETANEIIKANQYFTIEDDGRQQTWVGNIWMNPPYSQPLVTEFCALLVEKLKNHEIKQACVLVNNATETNFYQNMMGECQAVCFIKGRVKFIDQNGESTGAPLQGQTILYFGEGYQKFAKVFSQFGVILYA
jgi:ParB family chromosome partitioning protein